MLLPICLRRYMQYPLPKNSVFILPSFHPAPLGCIRNTKYWDKESE